MSAPAWDRAELEARETVKGLEAALEGLQDACKATGDEEVVREVLGAQVAIKTALHRARNDLRKCPVDVLQVELEGWLESWRKWDRDDSPLKPATASQKARQVCRLLKLRVER